MCDDYEDDEFDEQAEAEVDQMLDDQRLAWAAEYLTECGEDIDVAFDTLLRAKQQRDQQGLKAAGLDSVEVEPDITETVEALCRYASFDAIRKAVDAYEALSANKGPLGMAVEEFIELTPEQQAEQLAKVTKP